MRLHAKDAIICTLYILNVEIEKNIKIFHFFHFPFCLLYLFTTYYVIKNTMIL